MSTNKPTMVKLPCIGLLMKGHVGISISLLANGANIDLRENKGKTALMVCMFLWSLGCSAISRLVKGQILRRPLMHGCTPLHAACQEGHVHIAEYLLSRGVDVNATMHDGRTPLHVASRYREW